MDMLRLLRRLEQGRRTRNRRLKGRLAIGSGGLFAFAGIAVAAVSFSPAVVFAPIVIPLAMLAAAVAVLCVAFVITIPIAFGLW